MISDSSFGGLWHRNDGEFDPPSQQGRDGSSMCLYAQKFSEWAEELALSVVQEPTIIKVNQAKVQLLDKFFEWRTFAPKRHRHYTTSNASGPSGHTCLFHVLEAVYDRLKVIELSLTPPMLFLPTPPEPPPPPPPPPQIAGVFIGELEDE
jgi:hypothetical protein